MNKIALFILSTENYIDPDKDTSYLLMLEAQRRGLKILICDHRSIQYTYDKEVKKINIVESTKANVVEVLERKFVKDSVFANSRWADESRIKVKSKSEYFIIENFNLTDASVIFMRSDPPVDNNYLEACSCLESIKDEVLIVNNPTALINFNEKL